MTGIGIRKAGEVFYNALLRKTSSWRYATVRLHSLQAVVQLYGANSAECQTVKNAWNAISVPVQSVEPACGTQPGNDFSMQLNPISGTVQAGQSITATVSTQTTAGNPQTVTFSASGLPPGATPAFSPASVQSGGSSAMTISTTASTPAGTYQVTVKGDGTSVDKTAVYSLTVQSGQPGRTFSNDTNYSIYDFQTTLSRVTSTATGSAASPVRLSITISHTCAEDLHIHLIAPDRTSYHVKSSTSGACNSFGTRTYQVVVNEDAAGVWELEITDDYRVDQGYLDKWSITL